MTIESALEESIAATVIGVDRDKNSQYAVKWAVENLPKNSDRVILVHVRTQILAPKDAVPKGGHPLTEAEMGQLFLPYKGICARKGVRAKEVVLYDPDVSKALVDYINNNSIRTIVVGASSRNSLTRAFRNADLAVTLGKTAPDFCLVYAVSKGKVQNLRPSSRPPTPSSAASSKQASQTRSSPDTPVTVDFRRSFSEGSWRSEGSERISCDTNIESMQTTQHERFPRSLILSHQHALSDLNLQIRTKGSSSREVSTSKFSDHSGPCSFRSSNISFESLDHSCTSDNSMSSFSPQTTRDLEAEMKMLKLELKQTMDMYNSACKEANTAKQKAIEIDQWKTEEAWKVEEAKQAQEAAWAMAEVEKQKSQAAIEAAQVAQRLAELESQKRKNAEMKATYEAGEKKKAMDALARTDIRCRKCSIEEIKTATNYFSKSLKIGEGGCGPVYKAFLDHTAVAIKVLKSDMSQGLKQFQREVEVLSCMYGCLVYEYGCLVYEYMENGSLEDRIFRKNYTPSIPWRTRFKIAAEIATALLLLHQTRPEPLVHRDLKPANILLDQNYVSKISDVGLARLVPPSVANAVTQYQVTAAAGTFCYIDPEYQQTGILSVKSDIYSLGVMLLQLVTAKPPIGLSYQVAMAIRKGTFSEMVDPTVTDWPVQEALSFAKLALHCCELRRKDRPDLDSVILPELKRLKRFWDQWWVQ